MRRSGSARRAELMLGGHLPPLEMELPLALAVRKGDVLRIRFNRLRLFPDT